MLLMEADTWRARQWSTQWAWAVGLHFWTPATFGSEEKMSSERVEAAGGQGFPCYSGPPGPIAHCNSQGHCPGLSYSSWARVPVHLALGRTPQLRAP